MDTRIVLAYSGGLKASVAIPWLVETYRAQVVAVVLDLGQGEDLADVRHRAIALGAARCHVIDAREEFARDFIVPSLKADALLEGRYPLSTALARAVIAKTLVTIARIEDTKTVAHSGTGKDHLRLTSATRALDDSLRVIACAEAWTFSDSELANVAERHQIAANERGSRVDQNLWGRTVGRSLDGDAAAPREQGPDHEAVLEIEFARGVPVALNGVTMPPGELIDSLATIGAQHGIGRLSRVTAREESRVSEALYDAPAAVLLHTAHAELQRSLATGAVRRFAPTIASAYADVIDRGEWHANLRPALDGFVNEVQQHVTGMVRLTLFKGGVTASSIRQPAVAKP